MAATTDRKRLARAAEARVREGVARLWDETARDGAPGRA
jgi:Tfp pilus assembly protein PilX